MLLCFSPRKAHPEEIEEYARCLIADSKQNKNSRSHSTTTTTTNGGDNGDDNGNDSNRGGGGDKKNEDEEKQRSQNKEECRRRDDVFSDDDDDNDGDAPKSKSNSNKKDKDVSSSTSPSPSSTQLHTDQLSKMCPVKKKAKHNEDAMPIDNGNDNNDGDNDTGSDNACLRQTSGSGCYSMNGGGSTATSTATGTTSVVAVDATVITNARLVQDSDVVILHDFITGKHIKNSTRVFADQEEEDTHNTKINVRKMLPELGKESIPLIYDTLQTTSKEVKNYAESFTQYACAISAALWSGKNPLVFCRNGRSRSPSFVAAFFILFRGVTYDFIRNWMNEVYPAQRPATAKISVDFPNHKFENVLKYIQDAVVKSNSTKRKHLSGVVKYCSNVYGHSMLAGSYAWLDGQTDGLDPLSILTLHDVTSTSLPSSPPTNRRMTRSAVTKRRLSIPANGLTIARLSHCTPSTINEGHYLQRTVAALSKNNNDLRKENNDLRG